MALRLEGGVTAIAVGGRFGWSSHPRSGPQRVAVVGTKGTLSAEVSARRVEVYNAEPDFAPPEVDPLDPMGMWFGREPEYVSKPKRRWVSLDAARDTMVMDAAHFVDCIDNDVEPDLNAAAAAGIAETILAGYESAARGEEVSRCPWRETSRWLERRRPVSQLRRSLGGLNNRRSRAGGNPSPT